VTIEAPALPRSPQAHATDVRGEAEGPPRLRAHLSASRGQLVAIALAVFGMFASVIVIPYANGDDYPFLWMAISGKPTTQFGKSILDATSAEGRPLLGVLDQLGFSAAGTIENLRFVRLFAVLGVVALGMLLQWALVRAGIKPTPAALIAVLVCSLPAFGVYVAWTTSFTTPWSAALAGGASMMTLWAMDSPPGLVLDRLVGAATMMLAALLIYQPTAMFFWVFLAVALVGARFDPRRAKRLVVWHLGLGAACLALAYAILKLSLHLLGNDAFGGSRSHLSHDVSGKLSWFFRQPLYRSLNLFDLTPTPGFAAVVVAVAAGGILLWLFTRGSRPLLYVGLGLLLVPLTYLPDLLAEESWAAYRTEDALSALLALYFCVGALGLWLVLEGWLGPRISTRSLDLTRSAAYVSAFAFVGVSAFLAAQNVTVLIAEPQILEVKLIRSQVATRIPTGAQRIGFVQIPPGGGATTQVEYDEFGYPSTQRSWVSRPEVYLILREEGRLLPGTPPPFDLYSWNTTVDPTNEPTIDIRSELSSFR
jgi:hypothetical protein